MCGRPASPHGLRLFDMQHGLLAIPFWMKVPEMAASPAQFTCLAANSHATVSNLDLYPTILELLGYAPVEALSLSGNSLLRPLPLDRTLVSLNSGALRTWDKEPFAIARGQELLIYHDLWHSFELVTLDAPQSPDRWPSLPFPQDKPGCLSRAPFRS